MDDQKRLEKFKRKCNLTALNYGNLANSLIRRKTTFQILLPYYSVVGILNALLSKFFNSISPYKITILSYWGIIISVTFLVISMQISMANYPERIEMATKNLNILKNLQGSITSPSFNLDSAMHTYNEIVENGIIVSKRYFYSSCKTIDRNKRVKKEIRFFKKLPDSEVRKHFSLIEIIEIYIVKIFEIILFGTLFCLPIIVYVIVLFLLPNDSKMLL